MEDIKFLQCWLHHIGMCTYTLSYGKTEGITTLSYYVPVELKNTVNVKENLHSKLELQ